LLTGFATIVIMIEVADVIKQGLMALELHGGYFLAQTQSLLWSQATRDLGQVVAIESAAGMRNQARMSGIDSG
jgi:hypothetical protein